MGGVLIFLVLRIVFFYRVRRRVEDVIFIVGVLGLILFGNLENWIWDDKLFWELSLEIVVMLELVFIIRVCLVKIYKDVFYGFDMDYVGK